MANAKIRWTQKVMGRDEGHIEVCEIDTPLMKGCLKNRRFEILESYTPPVRISAKPKPRPSESDLMGLTKPKGDVEA